MVSDNDIIEIQYPGVERAHAAPAHVRLLNVGVYFDFWVKSTDAVSAERRGDMGLRRLEQRSLHGRPRRTKDAKALDEAGPR